MKITSITLDNVRRFTDPVTVGPIGTGLTLLCEPNEAGKSTLFDALHALFFLPHGSKKEPVKKLQPHSGGKVAVECELEHEGATWRIRKEWMSTPSARVWRNGTLVHQSDAAETWLSTLVTGDAGGPAGLLWVRQGRTSLRAPEKKTDADREQKERQQFVTAIVGAMDAVTGGERMDRALDRVMKDLGALAVRIDSDDPRPKAGGPWAVAADALATLETEEQELAALVDSLQSDLGARAQARARLAELDDPDATEAERSDLTQAEAKLREAEGLARDLDTARTEAKLAEREAKIARDAAETAAKLARDAAVAAGLRDEALGRHGDAQRLSDDARKAHEIARARLTAAREAKRRAEDDLRAIDRAEARARQGAERKVLEDRLAKAAEAEDRRIAAMADAKAGPDRATVDRIDARARDLDALRRAREAGAPRVSARYDDGAPRVVLDGAPLEPGQTRALPPGGRIGLPGIGELTITLATGGSDEAIEAAERALRDALASGGWADLDALHAAARARAEAETTARQAADRRDLLAPEGIDALREHLAGLRDAAAPEDADLPPRDTAEAALTAAIADLARAEEEDSRTGQVAQDRGLDLARTSAALDAAADRLRDLEAQLAALPAEDPAARDARLSALDHTASEAQARVDRLAETTPDLSALRAQRDRRRGIVDTRARETGELRIELGKLNGRIETRMAEGAEEALDAVRDRLGPARETLARRAFEVATLRRLRAALESAKKAAHETYFGPVVDELRPLLADLWEEAEIVWSGETLLPEKLVRRGTEEDIDILSGGTQEQIAFLVRLAFARLLARTGRPTPLILDDALVYSDDDRIEKMFDALHRAAGDLQIIVLSCRQRAFAKLGAPALSFRKEGGA